ncbi:SDR family NAD(P)-dependent oxidoreductase [Pacificispira sp.]|uniref:SDR family NAD(P)-dependent oxidoreductase n=1 Tax=Pacificispira sp. TaxID=2888761 RepID=UPI003B51FB8C
MTERMSGKVVLVTGAGSIGPGWGNGKAAAVLYAREGASVVACDINRKAAEETVGIIEDEGGTAMALTCDVSIDGEVAETVTRAVSAFGRLDVLHNNVGIVQVGGPEDLTEAEWDHLMAVNLKSIFLTARHAIPVLLRQPSSAIVNISSIAGMRYIGYPCLSYAASKGAINQATQNIAVQYAARGLRANCVLPGLMDTPQIRHYVTSGYGGDADAMISKRNAACPTGRMGDAWDVARAALFLASDEARYITGQCLVVDGGITARIA